jgi:hypothetical protein
MSNDMGPRKSDCIAISLHSTDVFSSALPLSKLGGFFGPCVMRQWDKRPYYPMYVGNESLQNSWRWPFYVYARN